MKGFLTFLLVVPGLLLLSTPDLLPIGLVLIWMGWWVYERSGMRDSDSFINIVIFLGGLGALLPVYETIRNWIRY